MKPGRQDRQHVRGQGGRRELGAVGERAGRSRAAGVSTQSRTRRRSIRPLFRALPAGLRVGVAEGSSRLPRSYIRSAHRARYLTSRDRARTASRLSGRSSTRACSRTRLPAAGTGWKRVRAPEPAATARGSPPQNEAPAIVRVVSTSSPTRARSRRQVSIRCLQHHLQS